MGLVQIGFLGALAGLAVPIVIHLVAGRRARRVELGTLRFLKAVLRENALRRRLKRWLLLALRITCVALMALLFARPYLESKVVPGRDRLVVLLVDRSASMGVVTAGETLLDRAVQEAGEILATCGEGTQLELASFDCSVYPQGVRMNNGGNDLAPRAQQTVAAWLDSLRPGHRSTDYSAAMAWARDMCASSNRSRKDIFLLTDLQLSGFDQSEAVQLPSDVLVHVVDLGQAYPGNVAVTRTTCGRTLVRPDTPLTVAASVLNAGQFAAAEVPVVLHLQCRGQQVDDRRKISLPPGTTATVRYELPPLEPGLWHGFVCAEIDDDLACDNRRHLALKVAPAVRVLVVDGDPGTTPRDAETYFLETALRLAPPGEQAAESPFQPERVPLSDPSELPPLDSYDLVVLANAEGITGSAARRLGEFVDRGGGLLVFTGDRVRPEGYLALQRQGLVLGRIGGTQSAGFLPYRLQQWEREHSIFHPFSDPQYGDLTRIAFQKVTRVDPRPDASVLAWFPQQTPALIEGRHGRGKILWFASACDRDWGDWPRSRLYLPLVHRMLGHLAGLNDGGPVRPVLVDDVDRDGGDAGPGLFDRGDYHEVLNINPRESEMDRCGREEFAARFACTVVADEGSGPPATQPSLAANVDLRPDELWHWILLILLGVLLMENVLANRTTA